MVRSFAGASVMIRLAICDDHEMVREALSAVLESFEGISVVGAAESLHSLAEVMGQSNPEVVLVDVRLGTESGIDVARHILGACPSVKIIMLTSFADDQVVVDAFDLGASAFMLKSGRPQELVDTIRAVSTGSNLFDLEDIESARRRLETLQNSGQ